MELTKSEQKLKSRIWSARKALDLANSIYHSAIRECRKHVIVPSGSSAVCEVCAHDFGWYCPKSPDHTCYYYSHEKNDRRVVDLINGKEHKLPEAYNHANESDDWCIFCGQPDERK